MAATKFIPTHACGKKSIQRSLKDILDYGKNPLKTENGKYVSAYECSVENTTDEFYIKKRIYEQITGRTEKQDETNVLCYHLRQSFAPDEVSPEQANEIGRQLALEMSGGNHQFIVCTHTDKKHIHNHIYINSTTIDCSRKFDNH